MEQLKSDISLAELQAYVREIERERGFSDETGLQKCLLLGEEIGELFKAVRRQSGLKLDPASTARDVAEELADVLLLVSAIANRFEIRLESALRDKEERNRMRKWR